MAKSVSKAAQDTLSERWAPVRGYEGLYEVSDHGRVRSARGVIRKTRLNNGYPHLLLCSNSKYRHAYVHRLVAIAFCEPRDGCGHVNHIDSTRTNNHYSNLEWCTRSGNMQHAANAGKIRSGKGHEWSVITESNVLDIRQCKRAGIRMCDAARMLGIHYKTVSNVWYGTRWKHLNG